MVSKAIASLDAWLVRAEAVLAEQREHGLSPTLGMLKEHDSYEWTLTLAPSQMAWQRFCRLFAVTLADGFSSVKLKRTTIVLAGARL